MVIAGRSVHLTTLFHGQAWISGYTVICAHTFACNWQQPFLNESPEGRRMTVEIISWSISTKVWDRAGIELATPGSAVRHASVARHVTDCTTRPGISRYGLTARWEGLKADDRTLWLLDSGQLLLHYLSVVLVSLFSVKWIFPGNLTE